MRLEWNRTQLKTFFLLAVIVAVAFGLRIDGYRWGLPFRLHPDEWKYVGGAGKIHLTGEWNPDYFRNPPGLTYLNAAWFPLWLELHNPVEIPSWLRVDVSKSKATRYVKTAYLYRPFDLVAGARFLSALFGAAGVVLLFFLSRQFLSYRESLMAAVIYAVSFLSVRDSHFAVNDIAMTFWVMLGMWVAALAYRCNRYGYWILACILAGIAVAFKYNAFPLVLCIIVLRFLHAKSQKPPIQPVRLITDALLFGAVSVLMFLVICPFPILDPSAFWGDVLDQAQKNTAQWTGQKNSWAGFLCMETLWISEGFITCAFAVWGFFILVKKRCWVYLLFPLFYLLLILAHSLFFARFVLPLLPWMAIAAAVGIQSLVEKYSLPKWVGIALVLLALVEPLGKDLRSNDLIQKEDTRIQTLHWLMTEEPEIVLMSTGMFGIPFVYRDIAEPWSLPLDPRLILMDKLVSSDLHNLDTLSNYPIRYVSASSFMTFPGYLQETYAERRAALMSYAGAREPFQTFSPFRGEWTPALSDIEDTYSPIRGLWKRHYPGPVVEIFLKNGDSTR
jgi:4-amino-4-deoxy-L-arabinose transferase-like glycosyltransferase